MLSSFRLRYVAKYSSIHAGIYQHRKSARRRKLSQGPLLRFGTAGFVCAR
jgi:hypothetical protein